MRAESVPLVRLRGLVGAWLALPLLAACTTLPSSAPPSPHEQAPLAQAPKEAERIEALWTFYRATRALGPAALARERSALAHEATSPLGLVQQALLLSRPPGGNLARALSLLNTVLASDAPEAQALQPVASLLADQLLERQRLEATNERLTRQLERTGQQLKESQRQADELREKLEALAEIERTLPARPPASPSEAPVTPERRTPQ